MCRVGAGLSAVPGSLGTGRCVASPSISALCAGAGHGLGQISCSSEVLQVPAGNRVWCHKYMGFWGFDTEEGISLG